MRDLEKDFDHWLPYHSSRSVDGGSSWSPLQPLHAGCARPRLLNVEGTGTLLLSGGRYHAGKTSDVLLWASKDAGKSWTEHSISYEHNRQSAQHNKTSMVSSEVNSTKWPIGGKQRLTSAYTALVRLGPKQVLVTYDLHTALGGFPTSDPRSDTTFSMVVTVD